MVRVLAAAALILLVAGTSSLSARQTDSDEKPKCNAATAREVSIKALHANAGRFEDVCVKLRALQMDDLIFAERDDIYAYSTNGSARGVIGIAYDGRRNESAHIRRGVFIGRVVGCSDQQVRFRNSGRRLQKAASKGGEIILTHHYGFCGQNPGPALYISEIVDEGAVSLERLISANSRRKLGNLVPVAPHFDFQGKIRALTDVALRYDCDKDFVIDAATIKKTDGAQTPNFVLPGISNTIDRRDEMLADVCNKAGAQVQLFEVSGKSGFRVQYAKLDVLICVCRAVDCSGRWPVALMDTNWSKTRPYFCQRVTYTPRRIRYDARTRKAEDFENWTFEFPHNNGLNFDESLDWFIEPVFAILPVI